MLNLASLTGPQDSSALLVTINNLIQALNAQSPGLFGQSLTSTGNGADATDDVIAKFILPPSFFTFNGGLRLSAGGVLAANANAKSVKFKINDTVTTVSLVGLNAVAANGRNWHMDLYMGRSAASAQSYKANYYDGTTATELNGTATEVETNAWTITVTGTSAASTANDVTAQVATLEVLR